MWDHRDTTLNTHSHFVYLKKNWKIYVISQVRKLNIVTRSKSLKIWFKKKIRGHIFPFLLYLFFYFSLCIGFCYQNLVFIFDWFFFQPDSKYHNSVDLFILVRWLCSIKSWHFLQRQWRNENEYGKTLYLLFLKHARSNISRQ